MEGLLHQFPHFTDEQAEARERGTLLRLCRELVAELGPGHCLDLWKPKWEILLLPWHRYFKIETTLSYIIHITNENQHFPVELSGMIGMFHIGTNMVASGPWWLLSTSSVASVRR